MRQAKGACPTSDGRAPLRGAGLTKREEREGVETHAVAGSGEPLVRKRHRTAMPLARKRFADGFVFGNVAIMRERMRYLSTAGVSLGIGVALGFYFDGPRSGHPSSAQTGLADDSATVERAETVPRRPIAKQQTFAAADDRLESFRGLQSPAPVWDMAAMLAAIPTMTVEECEQVVRMLRNQRSLQHHEHIVLYKALAKRWAALDPESAFVNALRARESDLQLALGAEAMRVIAAKDPHAALAKITEAKGANQRNRIAGWSLNAVAAIQPALAADYLTSHPQLSKNEDLFRMVAREYARQSPQAAMAWAQTLPTDGLRREATKNAWSGWAESAPEQAASAITFMDTKPEHDIYQGVAWAWSRKDPAAALQWIQGLGDEGQAARLIGDLLVDFNKLSPRDYLATINASKSEQVQTRLANRVAAELAKDDPATAWQWATALPEGKVRDEALGPIFNQWSERDPALAAKQAATLGSESARGEILRNAMTRWSQLEPDAAYDFVQQMAPGKDRDGATASVIAAVVSEHPEKALTWMQTIQDREAFQHVAPQLLQELVKHDATAATTIAAGLPAEAQPGAYKQLIRGWAFDHSKEAGEWINTLPPGQGRDSAIQAYVSVIDGMDPALATKWAQAISAPEERLESTFSAFERWSREAPAAAQAWFTENPGLFDAAPLFQKQLEKRMREGR